MKLDFEKILTLMFVYFKITGVIDWSWWLVFLPYIIDTGLSILAVIGKKKAT